MSDRFSSGYSGGTSLPVSHDRTPLLKLEFQTGAPSLSFRAGTRGWVYTRRPGLTTLDHRRRSSQAD